MAVLDMFRSYDSWYMIGVMAQRLTFLCKMAIEDMFIEYPEIIYYSCFRFDDLDAEPACSMREEDLFQCLWCWKK